MLLGLALASVALQSLPAPVVAASRTDTVGVIREDPATGRILWLLRNSNTSGGSHIRFTYGTYETDIPGAGDWDGDGDDNPGVVRQSGKSWLWLLRNSNTTGGANTRFTFGTAATDIPVSGDWDGDGDDTIGVVRNSGGKWLWLLRNENNTGSAKVRFTFGTAETDVPIAGDWDGNGTSTPGVVRLDADGNWRWFLRNSNSTGSSNARIQYGTIFALDIPLVGDWNGNGSVTVGLVRPTDPSIRWFLRNTNSTGSSDVRLNYGTTDSDIPIVGNWG